MIMITMIVIIIFFLDSRYFWHHIRPRPNSKLEKIKFILKYLLFPSIQCAECECSKIDHMQIAFVYWNHVREYVAYDMRVPI